MFQYMVLENIPGTLNLKKNQLLETDDENKTLGYVFGIPVSYKKVKDCSIIKEITKFTLPIS